MCWLTRSSSLVESCEPNGAIGCVEAFGSAAATCFAGSACAGSRFARFLSSASKAESSSFFLGGSGLGGGGAGAGLGGSGLGSGVGGAGGGSGGFCAVAGGGGRRGGVGVAQRVLGVDRLVLAPPFGVSRLDMALFPIACL